ncbi:hypothetical protein ETAE_0465 [Edwardsiella piscicida]|uniref:Uncharacterized protein n=2 Tax=Edwardsiella TaxID=635 RepID=A0A0H3DR89_EDWTF|nr:hypothetical protein ETAE_0465 [Edwardsiella tarda EIB202]ADM40542.1 hypothetical protein ETAF_0418 [Edwardsiella tarda FL6-60]
MATQSLARRLIIDIAQCLGGRMLKRPTGQARGQCVYSGREGDEFQFNFHGHFFCHIKVLPRCSALLGKKCKNGVQCRAHQLPCAPF